MDVGRSCRAPERRTGIIGRRWLALAVPLDEVNKIGRQLGKIGQSFMNHDRPGSGGSGSGTPRRPLARNALALHQEDGLVAFAAQHRVVAFNEHDGVNIRAEREERKINVAVLDTTHCPQETRTGTADSTNKPLPMGEDLSELLRLSPHELA